MIYLDENGVVSWTTSGQKMALEACLQEIRLWQGEKAIDIGAGVDYRGVFEQSVFLRVELQRVCDKFKDNFADIIVGDPTFDSEAEAIRINVTFYQLDGEVLTETIEAGVAP